VDAVTFLNARPKPRSATAALEVNVLMTTVPGAGASSTQLPELVLRVMAFVIGADASVDSYAHLLPPWLRE
jgi:hypothetical protein